MGFLRRRPKDIRVPTGKDAINFRKVLFLPMKETEDLLSNADWERLDLRCLTLMKTKMLRASCIARGLVKKGGKRKLLQRLTASLVEQKNSEFRRREDQEQEYQRQLDMLGGVWSFGSGFFGQLGHGDLESNATPRLIKALRGRGIAQVYAGFDSDVAFAVSRSGDVYVWGKRTGPTGLSVDVSYKMLLKRTYNDLYLSDEEDDDDDDDKNDNNQAAHENITGDNNVSGELDDDEDGGEEDFVTPVKLSMLCGEGVNHIAVGRVHCCAMTKDGDVFTWGHNDHCQLGIEPVHNLSDAMAKKARVRYGLDTDEPHLWERTIPETCVIQAAAVGTNHTLVATDKGQLLGFGATFTTGDHSSLSRSLAKLHVAQISCGALHAGIVTNNGQAYTWGSGDGGRLGHGDNTSYVNPKLVEALKDDIIFELSCACWHSVAVVLIPPLLKGGLVYTWGSGRLGQLAQGGKQISPTPGLVTDLLTTHVLIKNVCAGMYHNVALSVDDEVFTWGSNANGCLGRPEELAGLEEEFCAVPAQVEGMQDFVGRPCASKAIALNTLDNKHWANLTLSWKPGFLCITIVACGREFTLIATKPYIGASREELERREQVNEAQAESLERAASIVRQEKQDQLDRIHQEKVSTIVAVLNAGYPKCSICNIGTICPGFQPDSINPAICRHCMHDCRKHDDRHNSGAKLPYLYEVTEKLGLTIDYSSIPDIELEQELEDELEEEE